MLTHTTSVITIGTDGILRSARSGTVYWNPTPPGGLTRGFAEQLFSCPTADACAISAVDSYTVYAHPFCLELPQAILETTSAEPAGEVARCYREYVCTVLMPLLRRVSKILDARAAMCEWYAASSLTVDETVILLHPTLPLVGVSIVMERERQENDSLVNG